jgi:hypothetical protein
MGKSMSDPGDTSTPSSTASTDSTTDAAPKKTRPNINPQAARAAAGIFSKLAPMIPGLGGIGGSFANYANMAGSMNQAPAMAAPPPQPQTMVVPVYVPSAVPAGYPVPGQAAPAVMPAQAPQATTTVSAQVLPPQVINTPIKDKWALIVGVSKFQDSTIPQLHYAAKDAADFANFLIKEQNFAPDHVRVLLNEQATRQEVQSEIGDKFLPRVVKPDDLVVFFFSSHGSPANKDVANANFLVAYDTKKSDLYATGIEMQALTQELKDRVKANRVLIVLDACHSGGGADGAKDAENPTNFNMNQIMLGSGQLLICSSAEAEKSWESKRYQNGVFTHQLMESFRKNGARTKLGDAFKNLLQTVQDEVQQDDATSQTPKIRTDRWQGNDLILAAPPSKPQPLPDAVQKLLQPDSRH